MLDSKKSFSNFVTPTTQLRGVGKQTAGHLARLAIFSIEDLLFHLPSRYQDRTHIEPIRGLMLDKEAVIQGVITRVSAPSQGRTKLLCELRDETGIMQLRFFHLLSFQADLLKVGNSLRCYGIVKSVRHGLEMVHPECLLITDDKPIPTDEHFTPIYPATEGLSQNGLRKLMLNALDWLDKESTLPELLPPVLQEMLAFPTLKQALRLVHRPPRDQAITLLMENKTLAQQRLMFEELLAHRLSLLRIKESFQSERSVALSRVGSLISSFREQLPFRLTGAQARVIDDVSQDLMRAHPMLRLIQGDVGSGKTVIAALAMLQAVENGCQAVLMAPTELLAEQHHRVLSQWMQPLGVKVVFLSGNVKARARDSVLNAISSGEAQIIVGTHALFQEGVNYSALALIVIDEQHRFGVHQRALLREKGASADCLPHQMVMTATPIPRTLAMSFYADLDCSIVDELPPGRTPVTTSVLVDARRDEVVQRIRLACQEGRQVYWVCPLIDESEVVDSQAATTTAEALQAALPELKIGLIHGRMPSSQKELAMRDFQQAKTHLLVATTVIEVGVDVPNASVMIIENAERLGLSQLHQLRGRVGRGAMASFCVLLYQQPLSPLAKERLSVMRESTDGFYIAQRDLELRGPGEVLGTRQTGDLSFRVADLLRDRELLPKVQLSAESIMRDHPALIEPLITRWLGQKNNYGKV